MNHKIEVLKNKLKGQNIDGMIVSNPVNIRYLTGINAEGILLITRKEVIYITDSRYIEAVNKILTIEDEIIVYDKRSIRDEDYESFFMFCDSVGFEENHVSYSKYKEYLRKYKIENLIETDNIIENLRVIKEEKEIEKIKMACKITDDCFEHLKKFIKKGMTEKQVAAEIEYFFKTHGAEGISFEPIVASGANSSMPHAIPTDKKIEDGDPITIDMGCKYEGYCSDMTRTIFMGYVPGEIKAIYDLVLNNQLSTLKEYVDSGNIKIISKLVENNFEFNKQMLVHSLGHGVGLDIHENPIINSKSTKLLKENMVITDEPGIYITGKYGVRIEDTVLITKNGSITLTNSEKNYVVIDDKK